MVTSAIIGFPTMSVVVPSGSRAIFAWSRVTAIALVSARAGEAPEARTNATASQRRDDIIALLVGRLWAISLANDEESFNVPSGSVRQAPQKIPLCSGARPPSVPWRRDVKNAADRTLEANA
jgi:hypothetical protein